MGKKLIKNSPIRKSVVEDFLSTGEESRNANTEIQNAVNTENRKNSSKTVKLTVIVPEDIDMLLEDIARKRRKETGKNLQRSLS